MQLRPRPGRRQVAASTCDLSAFARRRSSFLPPASLATSFLSATTSAVLLTTFSATLFALAAAFFMLGAMRSIIASASFATSASEMPPSAASASCAPSRAACLSRAMVGGWGGGVRLCAGWQDKRCTVASYRAHRVPYRRLERTEFHTQAGAQSATPLTPLLQAGPVRMAGRSLLRE
jgi:hypothetical protein